MTDSLRGTCFELHNAISTLFNLQAWVVTIILVGRWDCALHAGMVAPGTPGGGVAYGKAG